MQDPDPEYLKAITELEQEHAVVFPHALISDLSQPGFDDTIVTVGCEEHICCAATSQGRLQWHYYPDVFKDKLTTYKTMTLPRKGHRHPELGVWCWSFMDENQGCASWCAYYDHADCTDPIIRCYLDDDHEELQPLESESRPWSEFKLHRN